MDWGSEWRHVRKWWAEDLGWFLKKKTVSWDLKLDEASRFLDLGEASQVDFGMPARSWVRWNSQHSKDCVSLSSCRKT